MEWKYLGMGMVLAVSSGVGFSASVSVRKGVRQLRDLIDALEPMRCEISCRLTPLETLCGVVSRAKGGEVGALFRAMELGLQGGANAYAAAANAVAQTRGLHLPGEISHLLTDLLSTFGTYDLDGQLRLIEHASMRMNRALEAIEAQKTARCRSYEILGVCTGLAAAILAF